jgi:hypothetical protein
MLGVFICVNMRAEGVGRRAILERVRSRLLQESTLIGDKAYDSSTLRQTATDKGVKTCIPGRTNRTTAVKCSPE